MKNKLATALVLCCFLAACSSGGSSSNDGVSADTAAPSVPAGLLASAVTSTQVNLTWTASTDNVGVSGYRVYRSATQLATPSTPTYTDTGLTASTEYCYTVSAYDAAGNASAASGQACATTLATASTGTVGSAFTIANTANYESGWRGAAFDGTNYLVTYNSAVTSTTNPQNNMAQFVGQSGNNVGSPLSIGQTQKDQLIAFDGTNYLIVGYPSDITGQFISPAGSLVGSSFVIAPTAGAIGELWGIAYGGGNYLVMYQYAGSSGNYTINGRIVSPSGSVGSEITIGSANGQSAGWNSVAFDGTNFLSVWEWDGAVIFDANARSTYRGRFITPASGAAGSEFTIYSSATDTEGGPVSVSFDGDKYLVVFGDKAVSCPNSFCGAFNQLGQLVTKTGTLSGGVINVSVASGDQILPSIAFDGTNYLVAWTDMRNDANHDMVCDSGEGTCMDVYGQYISKSGSTVGSEFVINGDAGNQLGGIGGFFNGKYLVEMMSGDIFSSTAASSGDVLGVLVTP